MVYAFQTDAYLYIVMEFVQGGDMFNLMKNAYPHHLSYVNVRFYLAEIVLAIEQLHKVTSIFGIIQKISNFF